MYNYIFRSNQPISTTPTNQPTSTTPTNVSLQPSNNLFPCLVCYPGTTNYSLVWLPIDVNSATAATLNPSILNSLIGGGSASQTLQQKTPIVNSDPSSTESNVTPSLNSNPLLANNLSAAITQSYLQLLQLQQLQQQAIVQQHLVKPDADSPNSAPSLDLSLPSVSSLLPLSSIGGPPPDILTQAVAGSIPSTTTQPRPLNLTALATPGSSNNSTQQSTGYNKSLFKLLFYCNILLTKLWYNILLVLVLVLLLLVVVVVLLVLVVVLVVVVLVVVVLVVVVVVVVVLVLLVVVLVVSC